MHSDPERVIVMLAELLISCVQRPLASLLDAKTATAWAGEVKKPEVRSAITPITNGFFIKKISNYATSTVSSTSTGEFSGSSATPIALRAATPASPQMCLNNSDAPFATAGWLINPEAPLT